MPQYTYGWIQADDADGITRALEEFVQPPRELVYLGPRRHKNFFLPDDVTVEYSDVTEYTAMWREPVLDAKAATAE